MKGYIKTIIAGAVIFCIGLIALLIIMGLNGWSVDGGWEMRTFESAQENDTLLLDYSAGEVEIIFYGGNNIKVEYPESEKAPSYVKEENGTLSLVSGTRKWYDVSLWGRKIPKTIISIPQNDILSLDLTLNAGTLKIASGTYSEIKLELNAGTVDFGKINCGSFNVELNAGTLDADGANCNKLVTKVNAGSAEIDCVICGNVSAEVNAGSLEIDVIGKKSEYTISVNKSAGGCNVSGQTGTGGKTLKAEVNAGSLEINFTN